MNYLQRAGAPALNFEKIANNDATTTYEYHRISKKVDEHPFIIKLALIFSVAFAALAILVARTLHTVPGMILGCVSAISLFAIYGIRYKHSKLLLDLDNEKYNLQILFDKMTGYLDKYREFKEYELMGRCNPRNQIFNLDVVKKQVEQLSKDFNAGKWQWSDPKKQNAGSNYRKLIPLTQLILNRPTPPRDLPLSLWDQLRASCSDFTYGKGGKDSPYINIISTSWGYQVAKY